jgi:methylation protein EvaC
LICDTDCQRVISFGRMPIANGFLTPDRFGKEYFFELAVSRCPRCSMVQLDELVEPGMMFHEQYAFYSSTSARMSRHFEQFANTVRRDFLPGPEPFVVELGSNDGIMLRHFAEAGIRHLGVEPSANVAKVATDRGVNTVCEFFGDALAATIGDTSGHADAILGANVMCHIADLHSVFSGVARLLKPDGVLIFEDPYLGDIVEKTSYDQIYDEHVFYFTVGSVAALAARHELEVIDVQAQSVHGGSMRYVLARRGKRAVRPTVARQRAVEGRLGLSDARTFEAFRGNVERSRDQLASLLKDLKGQGKRIVGYGATSKSTTVTNYCGITPDLVEFISDTTPIKQGKYSPGVHIPVRPYDEFLRAYPDYALLFAWNHGDEIHEKEAAFTAAGGRFVTYVPRVETWP